jgi:hypothetical protein
LALPQRQPTFPSLSPASAREKKAAQKAGKDENFATILVLKNLKEHGAVMLGQSATTIAKEQRSPAAVTAFYTAITAVATLGLAILLVSADVAFALAH